jgi:hypothetical protein
LCTAADSNDAENGRFISKKAGKGQKRQPETKAKAAQDLAAAQEMNSTSCREAVKLYCLLQSRADIVRVLQPSATLRRWMRMPWGAAASKFASRASRRQQFRMQRLRSAEERGV